MKKFFLFLTSLSFLLFLSCTPTTTPGNQTPENPDDQNPVTESPVTTVEITATDFGTDWDWEKRITIPSATFSKMESGDYLSFTTESSASSATYYQLSLKMASDFLGDGDTCVNISSYSSKYNTISLEQAAQTTIIYPTEAHIQSLKANGLTITGYGVLLTKMTITKPSTNPITANLSDSKATANVKRLYKYLREMYGSKVITGQMENAWSNDFNQLGKVYEKTGKYPALMGFDFIDYTGISWDASGFNKQTERAINFWNGKDYNGNKISDNHGIAAFCWHWFDPLHKDYSYKPGDGTDGTTSFRIPYNTKTDSWDTTSDAYKAILSDMDVVAAELLKLQNEGVPVIWRPLHEGAGNVGLYNNTGTAWFWWGAGNSTNINDMRNEDLCGECYIALWKLMYDYFTNTKGLHNLIWLWNGQNSKFYPGAEYVDMIGDDIYADPKDYSNQKSAFTKFQNMDTSKMVTLSECGNMPSLDSCITNGATWSYFMVWNDNSAGENSSSDDSNNNFWYGEKYNTDAHKTEVYTNEYAVTLDLLPDLTKY